MYGLFAEANQPHMVYSGRGPYAPLSARTLSGETKCFECQANYLERLSRNPERRVRIVNERVLFPAPEPSFGPSCRDHLLWPQQSAKVTVPPVGLEVALSRNCPRDQISTVAVFPCAIASNTFSSTWILAPSGHCTDVSRLPVPWTLTICPR